MKSEQSRKTTRWIVLIMLVCTLIVPAMQVAGNGATNEDYCEKTLSGAWEGDGNSEEIGYCYFYTGSTVHTTYACQANERYAYYFYDPSLHNYYTEGCQQYLFATRGVYCGPIDLPAIIAPSTTTAISFKGSAQTAGASLVIPGLDTVFPVSDLNYD